MYLSGLCLDSCSSLSEQALGCLFNNAKGYLDTLLSLTAVLTIVF